MPSKMVTDREKSARAVAAAAETHAAEVADALAPLFLKEIEEDETVPDLILFQQVLARRISRRREEMVAADEAHLDELADDAGPRRLRDEAAERLTGTLRSMRDLAEGMFGEGRGFEFLGLETQVSRDPAVVRRQGRRAVERLRDATVSTPEAILSSLTVDRGQWADTLERELEPLSDALFLVAREGREAETTLIAKGAAMDAYDQTFLTCARLLEALYRTAGLTELADRVRPSARRPGQTLQDPEAAAESTAASQGPEPEPTPVLENP